MAPNVPDVRVGEFVSLRKPHPCGGNRWEVTRVGADLRLRCVECGRYLNIDRYDFAKRYRQHLAE